MSANAEWRPEERLPAPSFAAWCPPWQIGPLCISLPHAALILSAALPYTLAWYDSSSLLQTFVKNEIMAVCWYGGFYHLLYVQRQSGPGGLQRKLSGRWPEPSTKFWFGDQLLENVFFACGSGVAFWSCYEWGMMRLAAAERIPTYAGFLDFPHYSLGLLLAIACWGDAHFYWVHRLLHLPGLYKHCHALHHSNVNPTPWSGLSFHPGEHLIYFTAVLVFLVVPAHPVHILYLLTLDGIGPVFDHTGFEGPLELRCGLPLHDFSSMYHYLHHRHLDCNYGDPLVPFDVWFGTFNDGKGEYGKSKRRCRWESSLVVLVNAAYLAALGSRFASLLLSTG